MSGATRIEAIRFAPSGSMPNHPRFPALVYRGVVSAPSPEAMEALFARNGWPPQWRAGVFPYHHYHTLGHEALGVAQGSARLLLGGPDGETVELHAGDVAVLPVGTGHCRMTARDGFLVVGAYPPGQRADICTDPATEEMLARIRALPVPATDPTGQAEGGLTTRWS